MRAVVVTDLAGPSAIVVQDIAEPDADGLVADRRQASGVCFPDLLISLRKYQIRPEPPFVPGTEVAGVVLSAPDDSGFVPGQRVLAVSSLGGYAERVAVHRNLVLPIPDELTFEDAASLIINYQTMEFALGRRARLQPGETVRGPRRRRWGGDVGDPVGRRPTGPGDRGRAPGRCRRLPARDRRRRRRPTGRRVGRAGS